MKSTTVKYVFLGILVLLTLMVMGKSLCRMWENYDDIIIESEDKSSRPPDGYSQGVCDPGYYDWTQGDHVYSESEKYPGPLRWRWSKKPDQVPACIPNEWKPQTIHNMVKLMETNDQFQV